MREPPITPWLGRIATLAIATLLCTSAHADSLFSADVLPDLNTITCPARGQKHLPVQRAFVGGKRIVRMVVCARSDVAQSTGSPSSTAVPSCSRVEPSTVKEGAFTVGASLLLEAIPVGRLARGKVGEAVLFGTKHELAKWLGEHAADRFPAQTVASCVDVGISAPASYEHLRFEAASLYVRDRGTKVWNPCPARGGLCPIGQAAWIRVPPAQFFSMSKAMTRMAVENGFTREQRMLLEANFPLHYATFVNWSARKAREAILVLDFEVTGCAGSC
jgi:hypothetical protein